MTEYAKSRAERLAELEAAAESFATEGMSDVEKLVLKGVSKESGEDMFPVPIAKLRGFVAGAAWMAERMKEKQ